MKVLKMEYITQTDKEIVSDFICNHWAKKENVVDKIPHAFIEETARCNYCGININFVRNIKTDECAVRLRQYINSVETRGIY